MNEEQEVSVGVVGHDQQLLVEFSDGQYVFPQHALDVLRRKENLIKMMPDLRNKTFGEFLSAVHFIATKQALNVFQREFLSTYVEHLHIFSSTK